MKAYIIEKRWLWHDGSPATDWEPHKFSRMENELASEHTQSFISQTYKDGLGHSLPNGRAAYTYEFRECLYEPADMICALEDN